MGDETRKNSIIKDIEDDYMLTIEEYYILYSFFVTYAMRNNQCNKSKNFKDYGWDNNLFNQKGLKSELQKVINLKDKNYFIFIDDVNKNASDYFGVLGLTYSKSKNYEGERGVLKSYNKIPKNGYLECFLCFLKHIRNCLAHGNYILKINSSGEKMIIFEDKNIKENDENKKMTARIIVKLESLLQIIYIIDKKGILAIENNKIAVAI